MKRSLYDEIKMRPGFGTPFVDSYGDEGFLETGLPSKLGSTIEIARLPNLVLEEGN